LGIDAAPTGQVVRLAEVPPEGGTTVKFIEYAATFAGIPGSAPA
jgi:hypothetical protein